MSPALQPGPGNAPLKVSHPLGHGDVQGKRGTKGHTAARGGATAYHKGKDRPVNREHLDVPVASATCSSWVYFVARLFFLDLLPRERALKGAPPRREPPSLLGYLGGNYKSIIFNYLEVKV